MPMLLTDCSAVSGGRRRGCDDGRSRNRFLFNRKRCEGQYANNHAEQEVQRRPFALTCRPVFAYPRREARSPVGFPTMASSQAQ